MKLASLFVDHLEELASLHLQRKAILSSEEFGWVDAAELEERFLANLDGVLENGPEAAEPAKDFLASEDEAEVFAGAIALASTGAKENIGLVLKAMQGAKELTPFVEALQLARTEKLSTHLIPLLVDGNPQVRVATAQVLGYRREGAGDELIKLLSDPEPTVVTAAAEALGRLGEKRAVPKLEKLLGHKDSNLEAVAITALLRLGSSTALARLRELCRQPAGAEVYIMLAMAGEAKDFALLNSIKPSTPGVVEAPGILGHIEAVPILLGILASGNKELHLPAAQSLEILTGAGLWEKVKVVEEIDFGDGDVEKSEKEVLCPSISPSVWNGWWKENQKRFDANLRWRLGKPFDFGLLIDELENPQSRFPRRQQAYLELVIRSGQNFPFEPDWLVMDQKKALGERRAWWQQNQSKLKPGGWFFGGK